MDQTEALVTLFAAGVGAAAGLGTTAWSFRRAAREARHERLSAEKNSLRALDMEIAVVAQLIHEESPSSLPTNLLTAVLGSVHHMAPEEQSALIDYSQAVLRYNSRVVRLIAYGAGKRAAGKEPGPEAPTKHAEIVKKTIPAARAALQANLVSDRFASRPGWRGTLRQGRS